MHFRIIIVGNETMRLAAELALLEAGLAVPVEIIQGPQIMEISMPTMFTNCNSTDLKRIMFELDEPIVCDIEQVLDGIWELRAWMENRIRQLLKSFCSARRQHRLPIFQPCWSARRWKSLT